MNILCREGTPAPGPAGPPSLVNWNGHCFQFEKNVKGVKLAGCHTIAALVNALPTTYRPHVGLRLEELHSLAVKSSNAGSVLRQLQYHKAKGSFPTHLNGIESFKLQVVKEFSNSSTFRDPLAELDNAAKKYPLAALDLEIEVKKNEYHVLLSVHSALSYTNRVNAICRSIDHELAAHVLFNVPALLKEGNRYGR